MNIQDYSLTEVSTKQLKDIARAIRVELKRRRLWAKGQTPGRQELVPPEIKIKKNCGLLSVPDVGKLKHKMAYLQSIIDQDWDYLFGDHKNDEKKYYVYIHKDPRLKMPGNQTIRELRTFIPFYIGKGAGDRLNDLKRNQGHGKRIKDILDAGYSGDSIPVKISENMGERDALVLESKLIYLFKTLYESSHGILVNLDIGRRPVFGKRTMPFVSCKSVVVRKKQVSVIGGQK